MTQLQRREIGIFIFRDIEWPVRSFHFTNNFCDAMFKEKHEILSIKYFTARVRTYPHDTAAEERQKIYTNRLLDVSSPEAPKGVRSYRS